MTLTLSLGDLSLSRGGRRLFSGLHLRLEAGQACALTGPNGSGKTSLLRAVAGLGEVDSGQIEFGGTDPGTARASGLHLLGHLDGLKASRTAGEELDFWTRWQGGGPEAMEAAPLKVYDARGRTRPGGRSRRRGERCVSARVGARSPVRFVCSPEQRKDP